MEEERGESCFVFHFSDIVFLSNYFFFVVFFFLSCRFGGNPHQMSFLLEVLTVVPEEVRFIFIEICLLWKLKTHFFCQLPVHNKNLWYNSTLWQFTKKIKEKNVVKSLLIFHSHPIFDELCSVKLSCLNIYIKTNN